jgi:uracil-DNA glycosylase
LVENGEKMIIGNDWDNILSDEWQKPYFKELSAFLDDEYQTQIIHPDRENVFKALELTSFADTKVVIIGQDPYHRENQAHGLCFSVREGVKLPPSLRNIYKELETDVGKEFTQNGQLDSWAKQGVLMLNTVLTVREGSPNSHKGKGWELFTSRIIEEINKKQTPVVFLLWGAHAEKIGEAVDNPIHKKLITVHPSPLSARRGFFGCRHFSLANEFLIQNGLAPIEW